MVFRLDLNPLARHTIWTQVIGGLFYWVQVFAYQLFRKSFIKYIFSDQRSFPKHDSTIPFTS